MSERPDPLAPPPGLGEDAVHDEAKEDTHCDVVEINPLVQVVQTRCTRNGTLRVWFGCVREHIGYVDLCDAHHEKISTMTTCWRCVASGQADTRVTIIRRQELADADQGGSVRGYRRETHGDGDLDW